MSVSVAGRQSTAFFIENTLPTAAHTTEYGVTAIYKQKRQPKPRPAVTTSRNKITGPIKKGDGRLSDEDDGRFSDGDDEPGDRPHFEKLRSPFLSSTPPDNGRASS